MDRVGSKTVDYEAVSLKRDELMRLEEAGWPGCRLKHALHIFLGFQVSQNIAQSIVEQIAAGAAS